MATLVPDSSLSRGEGQTETKLRAEQGRTIILPVSIEINRVRLQLDFHAITPGDLLPFQFAVLDQTLAAELCVPEATAAT